MTGIALRFQFLAVGILHMTAFATQFPMTAAQREFRIPVMIEPRRRPAFRRMAVFTLRAVAAFVQIVAAMTRDTFPFQLLLIQNSPVTASAGRIAVLPHQWKTCLGMIETDALP